MNKIKEYIGNKQFYKMCFLIIVPVIIHQGISSIASFIDNLMVNSYNRVAFIGVSTVNKLTFICFFIGVGVNTGIAIYLAQYLGAKNKKKIIATLQLSLVLVLMWGIVISLIIYFGANVILKRFLPIQDENDTTKMQAIAYGLIYSKIIGLFGILIMLQLSISIAFRSLKKTAVPMVAGIIGVVVNICLNYLLIYGTNHIPPLGVRGAAWATVIAKGVEILILLFFIVIEPQYYFVFNIFKRNYLTKNLIKAYLKKGILPFIDEFSWAIGLIITAKYITLGVADYVQAFNYVVSISDLFFVFIGACGAATSVIIGEQLGCSAFTKAKIYSKRLKALSLYLTVIMIAIMLLLAPILLGTLTSDKAVYDNAYQMIIITAFFLIVYAYNHIAYYTLAAGGDSIRSFMLDFYPTFLISIPALILITGYAQALGLGVVGIFLFNRLFEVIKTPFYYYVVKKGYWVKNITSEYKD